MQERQQKKKNIYVCVRERIMSEFPIFIFYTELAIMQIDLIMYFRFFSEIFTFIEKSNFKECLVFRFILDVVRIFLALILFSISWIDFKRNQVAKIKIIINSKKKLNRE